MLRCRWARSRDVVATGMAHGGLLSTVLDPSQTSRSLLLLDARTAGASTYRESFNPDASRVLSEDTVPERERWWAEPSERYAERKRLEGVWTTAGAAGATQYLRAWPARFAAAGLPRPGHARDVTAAMVLAWKERPMGYTRWDVHPKLLRPTTAFQALWHRRRLLREHHNPIARKDGLWRGRPGDAIHRRWFDEATIDRMHAGATERERLVLALGAWAGLRRREIASLQVGDVRMALDKPWMNVTRKGGVKKDVPISAAVLNAIRPFVIGKPPTRGSTPTGTRASSATSRPLGGSSGPPCHATTCDGRSVGTSTSAGST